MTIQEKKALQRLQVATSALEKALRDYDAAERALEEVKDDTLRVKRRMLEQRAQHDDVAAYMLSSAA
jgi:hypothetical protein